MNTEGRHKDTAPISAKGNNENTGVGIAALQFLKVIETMRAVDPEMGMQQAATLFFIASHPKCHQQDMEKALGFSQSSASRNVASLSKMHRLGKPGLDLVTSMEDPAWRRRKILNLTPKGARVVNNVLDRVRDSVRC